MWLSEELGKNRKLYFMIPQQKKSFTYCQHCFIYFVKQWFQMWVNVSSAARLQRQAVLFLDRNLAQ